MKCTLVPVALATLVAMLSPFVFAIYTPPQTKGAGPLAQTVSVGAGLAEATAKLQDLSLEEAVLARQKRVERARMDAASANALGFTTTMPSTPHFAPAFSPDLSPDMGPLFSSSSAAAAAHAAANGAPRARRNVRNAPRTTVASLAVLRRPALPTPAVHSMHRRATTAVATAAAFNNNNNNHYHQYQPGSAAHHNSGAPYTLPTATYQERLHPTRYAKLQRFLDRTNQQPMSTVLREVMVDLPPVPPVREEEDASADQKTPTEKENRERPGLLSRSTSSLSSSWFKRKADELDEEAEAAEREVTDDQVTQIFNDEAAAASLDLTLTDPASQKGKGIDRGDDVREKEDKNEATAEEESDMADFVMIDDETMNDMELDALVARIEALGEDLDEMTMDDSLWRKIQVDKIRNSRGDEIAVDDEDAITDLSLSIGQLDSLTDAQDERRHQFVAGNHKLNIDRDTDTNRESAEASNDEDADDENKENVGVEEEATPKKEAGSERRPTGSAWRRFLFGANAVDEAASSPSSAARTVTPPTSDEFHDAIDTGLGLPANGPEAASAVQPAPNAAPDCAATCETSANCTTTVQTCFDW